jgi:hypothetical protein
VLSEVEVEKWNNYAIDRLRRYEEEKADPIINVRDVLRQGKSGQYIWELLQNAEDAHATNVTINLTRDYLTFEHDGKLTFTYQDAVAISKIGYTGKTDKPAIGQFGVGFKSVFKYASKVEVHTRDINFALEDYIKIINNIELPEEHKGISDNTFFKINFKNNASVEAYKDSNDLLKSLNHESILFLKYLKNINVKIMSEELIINKKELAGFITEIIVINDGSESSTFWYCKKQDVTDELRDGNSESKGTRESYLGFAFQLTDASKNLSTVAVEDAKIFTYFPLADQTSNFKFHIHAPFVINLSRTMLDTDEKNKAINEKIVRYISIFMAGDLLEIHKNNLLSESFLSVFPVPRDGIPQIFSDISKSIYEIFQNNKMVQVSDSIKANPSEIFQASPEIIEMIGDSGLNLFNETANSKYRRVDPKQTSTGKYFLPNTTNTRAGSFLRHIGVTRIDNEKLSDFFSELNYILRVDNSDQIRSSVKASLLSWLKNKDDISIRNLYSVLAKIELQKNRLSNLPIFRTYGDGNDSHARLEQVFLATSLDQRESDVIKSTIYFKDQVKIQKLEEIKEFFDNLGLIEKDPWVVLKFEIKAERHPEEKAKEVERISRFIRFYIEDKDRFLQLARGKIDLVATYPDGETYWCRPDEIYRESKDFNLKKLNSMADASEKVPILWGDYALTEDFIKMISDLGVNSNLNTIQKGIDITVTFLNTIINSKDLSLIKILWNFVNKMEYSDFKINIARNFDSETKVFQILKESSWIPMANGSFSTPYDCNVDELAPEFRDLSGAFFEISDFGEKSRYEKLQSEENRILAISAGFGSAETMAQAAKLFEQFPAEARALFAKLFQPYSSEEVKTTDRTNQIEVYSESILQERATKAIDLENNQEASQENYNQIQSNQRREKAILSDSEAQSPLGASKLSDQSEYSQRNERDLNASRNNSNSSGGTEVRQAYIYVKQEPTEKGQSIQAEKMAGESLSRNFVVKHEIEEGRIPKEMSEDNAGYDIKSTEKNGDIRFIEVKSISGQWGGEGITVSPSQINFAQEYKKAFWLYVVENIGKSNARLHKLQDPMKYVKGFKFNEAWKEIASSIDLENDLGNLREGSIGEEDIGSRIFHTDKGECWLVGWMQNGETVRVILKFDGNKLDETLPLNATKMRKLIKK